MSQQLDPAYVETGYIKEDPVATNPLLVRPIVGRTRRYDLNIDVNQRFGKQTAKSEVGAKQCVNEWAYHVKNKRSMPGKDLVALNKQSVLAGLHTAKQFNKFKKENNIRIKVATKRKKKNPGKIKEPVNGYGLPPPEGPRENMMDIISHKYLRQWYSEHTKEKQIAKKIKNDKRRAKKRELVGR